MKAIYQQPTTDIMVLETINMIAGSNGKLGTDEPGDINLGGAAETNNTYGGLSRRNSIWDDDSDF